MTTLLLYSLVFCCSIYWSVRLEKKDCILENISFGNHYLYLYFFLISIVPIILSGERYNVGTDFQTYLSIFEDINSRNILELIRLSKFLEPMYVVINKISAILFFESGKSVFYVTSILIFGFLYIGILGYRKEIKLSIPLSYLIFFCSIFPLTLNIQRQLLAVMIVFIAYRYLLRNETIKFIVMIFIAASFHSTALIVLPLFLFGILNKKVVKIIYITMILSPVFISLGIPLIQKIEFFGKYLERYSLSEYHGISIFRTGEVFLLTLPIIINRKLLEEKFNGIVRLYPVLLLSIPLLVIGGYEPWANRLIYYITILQVVIHPIVLTVQKNPKNKKIWLWIFISYYICYFILKFVIVGNEGIFPYRIN